MSVVLQFPPTEQPKSEIRQTPLTSRQWFFNFHLNHCLMYYCCRHESSLQGAGSGLPASLLPRFQKYLKPLFATRDAQSLVQETLHDVCQRREYHLMETDITDDHLRLLVSLQPSQTISDTVKMLKGNLDHQFGRNFRELLELNHTTKLWARGYFARSSGKVSLELARQYVDSQVSHHGYKGEWTKPLSLRNKQFKSPAFQLAHSFCALNYHLVLATQDRIPLFDEAIATPLFNYVLSVGEKHGFAIERIGLLPDHMHLLLEARPDVSIEDCAKAIMQTLVI